MKFENKQAINITLSPHVLDKLAQMETNAKKIYGSTMSRSAIIETLIVQAGDRKTQVISRIKSLQKELCDLGDELNRIKQEEEDSKVAHP